MTLIDEVLSDNDSLRAVKYIPDFFEPMYAFDELHRPVRRLANSNNYPSQDLVWCRGLCTFESDLLSTRPHHLPSRTLRIVMKPRINQE